MNINFDISELQQNIISCNSEVVVLSCGRGTGKTAVSSLIAIIGLLNNENVLVITPTYRQAKRDNFNCIVDFLGKMKIKTSINISDLTIKYKKSTITVMTSFGATTETFRGATKISRLIFDEAGSQSMESYLLAIPTMRDLNGRIKRIYAIGTPPYLKEHWMAQMTERDDVKVLYGNASSNPFIEPDYLQTLEREYTGLPNEFIRRELYGEMVFSTNRDSMFNGFLITVNPAMNFPNEPKICGLDIAGKGSDITAAVISQGRRVIGIEVVNTNNDKEVEAFAEKLKIKYNYAILRYDATGFGHLLTLAIENTKVSPVDFGGSGGIRFAKTRGLIYYRLAQKEEIYMDSETYAAHGKLIESELQATTFRFSESKYINLIKKEDIKKMLGRSPDRADAMALSFSHVEPVAFTGANIIPQPIFQKNFSRN